MNNSTKYFLLLSLFFLTNTNLYAQKKELLSDTTFDTFTNKYSSEFFKKNYHIYTLEHFIDNYYSNGHYQIETTGTYAQPDQYVFSLTGYSYKWNKFYYDGIRINDISFPGASLHKPMLLDKNIEIDPINSRIDFSSASNQDNYVYGQWNNGSFGDMVPWTDAYTHLMHGHKSGPEKTWKPIPERKKTRNSGLVYFSLPSEKHNSYGYVSLGNRMITNFNYIEMDDYYSEDYFQFHYHGDINLNNKKFDYLITYNKRDNLNAEYFFGRDETASFNNLNFSLYAKNMLLGNGNNPLIYNAGLNVSFKDITKNDLNFARNVIDQDGESLEPFYSDGKSTDFILSANGNKKLTNDLNFVYDIYNGVVSFSPHNHLYRNDIHFENNLTPFHSLYITEWNSEAFSTGMLENTLGLDYLKSSSNKRFSVNLKGNLTFDGIYFSPKSISSLNYELGLNLTKKLGKKLTSTLDIGKRRVPYEYEQVKFLSDKYQSGESYYWNDTNNNRKFETNEKGALYTTTGGKYHTASSELKQPEIYYLDYGNKWEMGRKWELTFLAQYRKFANQWTVEYSTETDNLGYTQANSENQNVFYLAGEKPIDYNVVPFNKELYERLAEKKLGWLFNSPFYGGVTLNLEKKTKNTYFYISATAYEVVGISAMGNGVRTNNLSVLSESLANPNTYINSLGRLDSDRAYIVRIYYHQNISKKWNLGFQVKYKDGQPVNRNVYDLTSNANGNQFAFWNIDTKGINPFTGQFGVREGGFWNYELRFQHTFKLADRLVTADLNIYNIMDVATPLNNYNFPEPDEQYALDLQIPRGFLLSLNYLF